MKRAAGILLHPSSLPGPYGIGELGQASRDWLAWLDAAGQRVWQVLPLTVTDGSGSPYASPTAFAHEPLLLSIDELAADGWLQTKEKPYAASDRGRVDAREVRATKAPALVQAAERVRTSVDLDGYGQSRPELVNWAMYRALEEDLGRSWVDWPVELRDRDPQALAQARDRLSASFGRHLALQWLFDEQWGRVRREARARGIELWGDVPFFVSHGSADVWERPDRWRLGPDRRPTVVSGVPPDAFAADGQWWGHPHYDEQTHAAERYRWWVARMRRALETVDRVRIDHFRGVEAVWEVPATDTHARHGRWIPGPGAPLLTELEAAFPELPFLAEDLGVITDEVRALRDTYGLPGMVVLQFAFSGDTLDPRRHHHPFLPHQHRPNQVCFTGTHDNDTLVGWWRSLDDRTRDHVRRYVGEEGDATAALMRVAWRSPCAVTIVPFQDALGLGSEARMNVPGSSEGNWSWRMPDDALQIELADRLAEQVELSGRGRDRIRGQHP